MDRSIGTWDLSRIKDAITDEAAEAIELISINEEGGDDMLIWPYTKNVDYSVKSGYHKLKEKYDRMLNSKPSTINIVAEHIWKMIWKIEGPRKEGWCKVNCDAAFNEKEIEAGIGVIIRDSERRVIGGMNGIVKARSSLIAEALAAKEGLRIAQQLQIPKIILESDSLQLVSSIENPTHHGQWEIAHIIQSIASLKLSFERCKVQWINRIRSRLDCAVIEKENVP
ncbi:hypothetical protein COLO4_08124 [Corchorus olitorius]|uniref:RNase H type-1 domain-containing protein n=1 Tax=Corchorus olitorius TaxID=93759 RepID=A0A1R3KHF4_9ROSI|nr:hypothetical protein COLO4_08124 [Corchorus olitorius]